MARVIGAIGSEKMLVQELHKLGVHSLPSLSNVEDHLKNSDSMIENLKESERRLIHGEVETMRNKYRKQRDTMRSRKTGTCPSPSC
jgi:hypothetical protein